MSAEGAAARPCGARLDAARPVRHRALPPPARAPGDQAPSDHHADRARRGKRARARAGDRRRRLYRQAVLGPRVHRARARAAAPRDSPERLAESWRSAISSSTASESGWRGPAARSSLGPTEFRLLEFLMERPGRVFSREQLLDGVWGNEVYIDERTVDVHVGRLRKALNPRRRERSDPHRARLGLLRSTRSSAGPARAALIPPGTVAGRAGGRVPADRRCASGKGNTARRSRTCLRRKRNPRRPDRRSASDRFPR